MKVEDFRNATQIGRDTTLVLRDGHRADGTLEKITPDGYARLAEATGVWMYPIRRVHLVRYAIDQQVPGGIDVLGYDIDPAWGR